MCMVNQISLLKLLHFTTQTSHIITEYLPEANMPTKFSTYAIYAKNLIDLNGRYLHMFVPHMKSLQSTM